jgi:hypothetical protein
MIPEVSYYLTDEAAHLRLSALRSRLAAEAVDLGGRTWPPESDFWRLPRSERDHVSTLDGRRT